MFDIISEQEKSDLKNKTLDILTAMGATFSKPKANGEVWFKCLAHKEKGASAHYLPKEGHFIKCFGGGCPMSGSNGGGDIFKYIGDVYHIDDFPKQVAKAYELLGQAQPRRDDPRRYETKKAPKPQTPKPTEQPQEPQENFRDQYKVWTKALLDGLTAAEGSDAAEGADYLIDRGINVKIATRFGVGFAAKWLHPNTAKEYPNAPDRWRHPRIIFPSDDFSYAARAIRAKDEGEGQKRKVMKAGATKLFNGGAIGDTNNDTIRVVEGELDALSIMQTEGKENTVAITGSGGVDLLVAAVKDRAAIKPVSVLVSLDDDDPGRDMTKKILDGLRDVDDVTVLDVPLYDAKRGVKDANDAINDPDYVDEFKRLLAKGADVVTAQYEKDHLAAEIIRGFFDRRKKAAPAVSTGFRKLDRILDGGLYGGDLYTLGAITSLGKSTFVLNIAENIAAQGRDVMYFSLEMGRDMIVSRSLSRITFESGGAAAALTARQFLNPSEPQGDFSTETRKKDAAAIYTDRIGDHLFIFDSRISGVDVALLVDQHIQNRNTSPVVVVDYLQVMAPTAERLTERQVIDENVTALKEIATKYDVPVICVSSFNRTNYNADVNLGALKESGLLEYHSDTVIGLQYHAVSEAIASAATKAASDDKTISENTMKAAIAKAIKDVRGSDDDVDGKDRSREPVAIDIKVLKGRNGRLGTATIEQVRAFNTFRNIEGR